MLVILHSEPEEKQTLSFFLSYLNSFAIKLTFSDKVHVEVHSHKPSSVLSDKVLLFKVDEDLQCSSITGIVPKHFSIIEIYPGEKNVL